MSTSSPSDHLSPAQMQLLRLLVYAHPAWLDLPGLRRRLGKHAGPREEANVLVERGLIEPVGLPDGEREAWQATRAGIALEARLAQERPLPDRVPLGRLRPRSFDHLCPPGSFGSCAGTL